MATYAAYRHIELDNIGYGKKRVLKPPGGGSSDIFGAGSEETSPRRMKNHNQSQLGSSIFGENNGIGNGSETPRGNKPGNDSYNRLFGPPEVPTTPQSKNHMRSNISLSGKNLDNSSSAKSTASSSSSSINGNRNGNAFVNDNNAHCIDSSGGSSCMPRNPVTGDGVDMTPQRRNARKSRDGNPVTGTGYTGGALNDTTPLQNGNANSTEKTNGTTPAPAVAPVLGAGGHSRPRVPPGGFSSGLW